MSSIYFKGKKHTDLTTDPKLSILSLHKLDYACHVTHSSI